MFLQIRRAYRLTIATLTNDIQKYARTTCADFSQTVKFIAMLEVKRREFQTDTGSDLDLDVFARILGSAIDEDALGRIEDAKGDLKDYEYTRVWVENRHTKLMNRQAGLDAAKER